MIFLPGCTSGCSVFAPYRGGDAAVTVTNTTETVFPDGKTEKVTTVVESNVTQPENPEKPAEIILEQNDSKIRVSTGESRDSAGDIAAISNLQPMVWAGIGLIILGAGVGFFTRGSQLMGAIILGLTGTFLIALSYILPTYPYVFLIAILGGIAGLITYVIITVKNIRDRDTAVTENVEIIENIKEDLPPEKLHEKFESPTSLARLAQSDKTKKLVEKTRKKIEKDG